MVPIYIILKNHIKTSFVDYRIGLLSLPIKKGDPV